MRRALVLGGTAWLGREIAGHLQSRGIDVTCLARGEAGSAPVGVHLVVADRRAAGAYESVRDVEWDEVIELTGDLDLATGALQALAGTARHWTLISSVSVYAANEPGANESATLVEPTDLTDYAHAKVAVERATAAALGDRLLIVRPGLIAGPGDPSDRFGYWVSRLALAGDAPVLVPVATGRVVQIIDVRDLARWVADAGTQGMTGTVNGVGSQHDLAAVLDAAANLADHSGARITRPDDWLRARGVAHWAGPRSLPLWLPAEATAFAQRSNATYRACGGTERDLVSTLIDTLDDERRRGLDRPRRAGLTREDELRLLAELA